jgi:hypothetical protein
MPTINNVNQFIDLSVYINQINDLEVSMTKLQEVVKESLNSVTESIKECKKVLNNYENTIKTVNKKTECPFMRFVNTICRVVLFIFYPVYYVISLPVSYIISSVMSLYNRKNTTQAEKTKL